MITTEREVLRIDYELVGEMCYGDLEGWEEIERSMVDECRWYNVFSYVVKNIESGKFYEFCRNEATADGECDQWDKDANGCVELTQVFPKEVTTIEYV